MNLCSTTSLESSEGDTTLATLVLNIFERVDEVWDTWQADNQAETKSPQVCAVTAGVLNVGHGALMATWAINWSSGRSKTSNWDSGLELALADAREV